MKAENPKVNEISLRDLEDLYLSSKPLCKSLRDDTFIWSQNGNYDRYLMGRLMRSFVYSEKDREAQKQEKVKEKEKSQNVNEKEKEDTYQRDKHKGKYHFEIAAQKLEVLCIMAKKAHKVLINLLQQRVPSCFITTFLQFLRKFKKQIKDSLNKQKANSLYNQIPARFIIDFIDLYDIKLSPKEELSLIEELINRKETLNDDLAILPSLFQNKFQTADTLITKLNKIRRSDISAKIIKRYHIDKAKYPYIQKELICNAARMMPKWEKRFSWEYLQEVYEQYPQAIAAGMNNIIKNPKTMNVNERIGYGSIYHRNPKIKPFLRKEIVTAFQQFKDKAIPNKLRTNKFEPSSTEKYLSLSQFGVKQQDVITVTDQNLHEVVLKIASCKIIGIDTQSIVARTTLHSDWDILALCQIAAADKIYLFNAIQMKKKNYSSKELQEAFNNPQFKIIGHTLNSDLKETLKVLGFNGNPKCECIDVHKIFKQKFPDIRKSGLASICEQLLGKPLCKQYTLTNWNRHPLLKNQAHYAALDAFAVLKVYQKLLPAKQPKPKENTNPKKQDISDKKQ